MAEHLQRVCPDRTLQIVRRRFVLGRLLAPRETSASGVYALVDTRKYITLRLPLLREVANLLRSETRIVHEAWLT